MDFFLGQIYNWFWKKNKNFTSNYIEDIPKKRMLNSSEIGPVIEGLLGTTYITGTSIFLDGGKNLY